MRLINVGDRRITSICAAILSLTAAALAEEHPDDLPAVAKVKPHPMAETGERAALTNAPAAGARVREAPEHEALAPSMLPGGPPAGGPPSAGPPLMAPPLRVVAVMRADFNFVGPSATQLDDRYTTSLMGLGVAGNVYGPFSIMTNLAASYDVRDASGAVSLLDSIAQFEPFQAFNIWLGRMIVAVDRSSLAGPGFVAPWIFTGMGHVDQQFPLPRAGFLGRGNGVTVWGSVLDGHLKYYASAVDLVNPRESPLFSGRISLALLEPEPGFYSPSSYFGRDILSIGVGGQSKRGGSVNPMTQDRADYAEYGADLLFEKNFGAAGVLNLEGAYGRFTGDNERTDSTWLGLASYVLPGHIAGARLQPLGRMQQAVPTAPGAPTSTLVDAQVGLILSGHFARLALGYRWGYAGAIESTTVYLGVQLIRP